RVNHAHPAVAAIGEVEVVVVVEGDAGGRRDLRAGGVATVASEPCGAVADDRRDDARGVDLADPVVDRVGDVHVALAVEGHVEGLGQLCAGGRAAVAVGPGGAVPGDRRDLPGRVDLANRVVQGVGDVEVPVGVGGDPEGTVQVRAGRRPTVAAVG